MLILAVEIISIIFMIVLIFFSILSFILLKNIYSQLRYKNYLMEKLNYNTFLLANKPVKEDSSLNNKYRKSSNLKQK